MVRSSTLSVLQWTLHTYLPILTQSLVSLLYSSWKSAWTRPSAIVRVPYTLRRSDSRRGIASSPCCWLFSLQLAVAPGFTSPPFTLLNAVPFFLARTLGTRYSTPSHRQVYPFRRSMPSTTITPTNASTPRHSRIFLIARRASSSIRGPRSRPEKDSELLPLYLASLAAQILRSVSTPTPTSTSPVVNSFTTLSPPTWTPSAVLVASRTSPKLACYMYTETTRSWRSLLT